jgi:hypothetical protein
VYIAPPRIIYLTTLYSIRKGGELEEAVQGTAVFGKEFAGAVNQKAKREPKETRYRKEVL